MMFGPRPFQIPPRFPPPRPTRASPPPLPLARLPGARVRAGEAAGLRGSRTMEKELFFEALRVVWHWARESVREHDSHLFFFHQCALWTRIPRPCIGQRPRNAD